MTQNAPWYRTLMKISDVYNAVINFVCVVLLTAQTIAILIMVFGRYIFNHVPQWSEQFSLFCMVWFSMFSIALAVRTDSHVKMEIIDKLVSPGALLFFKAFANLCTAVFGAVMVIYGMQLCDLTWATKLSAFRVPVGLQYLSAVAGGFFMVTNAAICTVEMFVKYKDEKKEKEDNV